MKNNLVVPGRWTGKLTSSSLFLTQQGQIFHWCKLVPLCLTLPELCLISTICELETVDQFTQEENDGRKLQWLLRRRERKWTLKVTQDEKKNGLRDSGQGDGEVYNEEFLCFELYEETRTLGLRSMILSLLSFTSIF